MLSKKGIFQYYLGRKYIRKENLDLATKIAERDYCREILPSVIDCIEALEKVLQIYEGNRMEEIYIEA